MLLAIDVGNTNIKIGLNEAGEWLGRWQIRTIRAMTADEYGVSFRNLLDQAGVKLSDLREVIASSVVPPVTGTWPAIAMMVDVLPAPLGPSRAWTPPAATDMDMPWTASRSP